MKQDYYIHRNEWEDLSTLSGFTNLQFHNGVFSLPSKSILTIKRDSNCRLSGEISVSNPPLSVVQDKEDSIPGEVLKSEKVTGISLDGVFSVTIDSVFLQGGATTKVSTETLPHLYYSTLLHLKNVSIKREEISDEFNPSILRAWYIGAQCSFLLWPRSTTRSSIANGLRSRQKLDKNIEQTLHNSQCFSRDWLLVDMGDYKFILSKVPNGYGPDSCQSFVFEYRTDLGKIPDEIERDKISQIVGFILGTQLSEFGYSEYDEQDSFVRACFANPRGYNILDRYRNPAMPSIEHATYTYPPSTSPQTENILSELIPRFLELENEYCLAGVLDKYWIARYSLVGANLPILSSAIEGLVDKVFKKYKHPTTYFEKDVFTELLKDEISAISTKLNECKYSEMLMNKIKGLNSFGGGERLRIMFDLLDMQIGEIEKNALRSRNAMAHTTRSGEVDIVEAKKMVKTTRAYEVLANRTILKILGYTGNYIDYYTNGHPERGINDPIPEIISP